MQDWWRRITSSAVAMEARWGRAVSSYRNVVCGRGAWMKRMTTEMSSPFAGLHLLRQWRAGGAALGLGRAWVGTGCLGMDNGDARGTRTPK